MNVLIVENERPAIISLSNLLKKIDPLIEVVGTSESVESTINWFQNNPIPDIIFMDIQLDDGLCFEIYESVKLNTPVIFTTAYDEYMLSAFKVNSIDYILKPIEESSLRNAIEKFKSIHYRNVVKDNVLHQLLNELNKGYKTRFLIKVGVHYKSVDVNEISCFYILERSAFMRTFSDKDYAVDYSLDGLQKMVDPEKFFRINRNCIINIKGIRDILSYSSSRLIVKLNNQPVDEMIVSREKVSDFKKWIDK